ncbi:tyrosine-protein kinase receptor TYRO3-like [Oscarella lobularis]|uniref:tyrosine-protein kinase receptor TYRO3-like n=1 Tax=Oscarella lobularis TaxID=121494 RepID=UPI0033140936
MHLMSKTVLATAAKIYHDFGATSTALVFLKYIAVTVKTTVAIYQMNYVVMGAIAVRFGIATTEVVFINGNANIVIIAVPTTLCAMMAMILTPPIVIFCKKRFACECTWQRHTTEDQMSVAQSAVEMQSYASNELQDSDIAAEIGDLSICPTRLKVVKDIGEGNFGRVYKCLLDGSTVAAKSAKSGLNARDFVLEALRMKSLDHKNVLTLIGICCSPNPEYEQYYRPMIVFPYMLFRLIQFGYQIAKGMEYLTGKRILHRDLAARNCMVNWDLTIKISDFGLARALTEDKDYYRITQGKVGLPIRWVALEGFTKGIFTTKSDIWSYGITLWEVMTMGMTPYPGVGVGNLVPLLQEGMRLSQPRHCPNRIFKLMADCWSENPEKRPSFQLLVNDVSEFMLVTKAAEYTSV